MLKQLHIKDFALVDELTLTFEDGFCVITGETGAGKSILIGALEILLGAKAHPDLIRAQCEEAVVEGVFGLEGPPRESAHPAQSDGTIQLRRRLSREGRGRIQINGETRTLAQLEGLGRGLVGLYGQHEYMDLALPARQLAYLDEFAGLDEDARALEDRRQAASRLYTELRDFDRLARTRAERIDLLTYQTGEIERGQVKPGEDEALEAEVRIMANSEKMASTLGEVEQALYSSDEAVVGKIGKSVQAVRPLTQIDPRLTSTADALASAQSLVQEAARDISGYLSRLEFDPARLEAAQQRLHDLDRLKKKYGGTLDRVLRTLEEGCAELEKLSTAAEDREEVARRFGQACSEFVASCEDLLKRRRVGARKLAREIEAGCGAVGLAKAAFSVEVAAAWPESGGGGGAGLEAAGAWLLSGDPPMTATYYFSANPGEPPRELARVASGGETSRLMLLLKNALSQKKEGVTLVFDEVDAGIGGAAAEAVGKKLRELARRHQVICITHLPQIACFADQHLKARKRPVRGRTVTEIHPLESGDRLEELARMLGGETITEKARAYAAELLRSARGGKT